MAKQAQMKRGGTKSFSVNSSQPDGQLVEWPVRGSGNVARGDLLVRLEMENAELRTQAVNLALQIHAFRENATIE
jgi:multidrug resistance efflux pump